eukprot:2287421-Prymnesium_polylepis.1
MVGCMAAMAAAAAIGATGSSPSRAGQAALLDEEDGVAESLSPSFPANHHLSMHDLTIILANHHLSRLCHWKNRTASPSCSRP